MSPQVTLFGTNLSQSQTAIAVTCIAREIFLCLLVKGGFGSSLLGQQVYHISRDLWSSLETRTVKNVCAPAAVIEDKIYIVGGELSEKVSFKIVNQKET